MNKFEYQGVEFECIRTGNRYWRVSNGKNYMYIRASRASKAKKIFIKWSEENPIAFAEHYNPIYKALTE